MASHWRDLAILASPMPGAEAQVEDLELLQGNVGDELGEAVLTQVQVLHALVALGNVLEGAKALVVHADDVSLDAAAGMGVSELAPAAHSSILFWW